MVVISDLDVLVSTTLARVAYTSSSSHINSAAGAAGGAVGGAVVGAASGHAFERDVFRALVGIHPWEHCVGPDHFDMALDLVGRSGTHYEFDSALLTQNTLYVVEAKKVGVLTRQHVGIFVHKLLDILLAPRQHIEGTTIKPMLVSAGSHISAAAWLHAISWGVLLISPQRPTPMEIVSTLRTLPSSAAVAALRADCAQLAERLWRPIDRLVFPSKPNSVLYTIATDLILDHDACQALTEEWKQCVLRAPTSVLRSSSLRTADLG